MILPRLGLELLPGAMITIGLHNSPVGLSNPYIPTKQNHPQSVRDSLLGSLMKDYILLLGSLMKDYIILPGSLMEGLYNSWPVCTCVYLGYRLACIYMCVPGIQVGLYVHVCTWDTGWPVYTCVYLGYRLACMYMCAPGIQVGLYVYIHVCTWDTGWPVCIHVCTWDTGCHLSKPLVNFD